MKKQERNEPGNNLLPNRERKIDKLNPFSDVVFKKIFRDEDDIAPLVTFLNDALKDVLSTKIVKIEYRNSEAQPAESLDGRFCLFDILCTDEKGDYFLIEIQLAPQEYIAKRMLYYTCGLHKESAKRGDATFKYVKSVYSICIANFVIWPEEDFMVNFKMRSEKNPNITIDGISILFLQIPKLTNNFVECKSDIERLIYTMLNYDTMTEEDIEKLKECHREILSKMDNINLSEDEYIGYLRTQNAIWAMIDSFETATKRGLKEGLEKGVKKGIEQGKIETIKAFKAANADINLIIAATGLTKEEIEQI